MAIQYKGDTPGKLWYAFQKTKAFFKAFGDYSAGQDAKRGAKNTGIALGTLFVGHMLVVPAIAAVPFLPLVASLAASVVAIHFAFKAFHDFRAVGQSRYVANDVSAQEDKWADNKKKGGFFKRLTTGLTQKKEKTPPKPDTRPRTTGPISKGVVFGGEGASFDFNDNADKPVTPSAPANTNNKPPQKIKPPKNG